VTESRIKAWLGRLPLPQFILLCVGLLGALFGASALTWQVAHHMAWWTFSLLLSGWALLKPVVSSVRQELRTRRIADRIAGAR
jgi:hypothetical protein